MHIPYQIKVVGRCNENKIATLIKQVFTFIDLTCNNWNPHSEISRLSLLPPLEPSPISPSLLSLLKLCHTLYLESEHRFDPTVEPISMQWKQGKMELESVIGFEHVEIINETMIKKEAVSFDLCAIAKGYAVDLLIEGLEQMQLQGALVNWGGEIGVTGVNPYHQPWVVQIENSERKIQLDQRALATSGTYLQTKVIENKQTTHLIDPIQKKPLSGLEPIVQVTVKADRCALADALATTLLLFENIHEAQQWLEKHYPKVTVWFNDA